MFYSQCITTEMLMFDDFYCVVLGLGSVSNLSVHPQSETSVLITWGRPASPHVTGYVLEWRPLCETPAAPLSFTLMDKNNSSTIVTGVFIINNSNYYKRY